MEIEAFIKKMKDLNSFLINFIDAIDDSDVEFAIFINNIENQDILNDNQEIQCLFKIISKIADNHHRTPDFFDKLEKIFSYIIKDISSISNFIPDSENFNKRILFLLFDKKLIKPDESFIKQYLESEKDKLNSFYYYLYPKLKEFIEEPIQKQIENEILIKFGDDISIFEKKCQIGENDSYICSLIRSDSIEEFIAYVNRTNFSLLSKIKPSVYETNSFLIDKEPTLIEYAAFFGSIQIIQYLKYNKVPLTFSLWMYAIHSNNAELIHFLEENGVKPKRNVNKSKTTKEPYRNILIESIKCHHNAISDYIKDNLYDQVQINDQNQFYDDYATYIIESYNFNFIPNDIESFILQSKWIQKGFNLSKLCFSLKHSTIYSSLNSIGSYSFSSCSLLTEITIPSSVTEIGDYSFSRCSSLEQITIPSSVTKIGIGALSYCTSLKEISIPSSLTEIGDYILAGCSSLIKIKIPHSISIIGNNSFSGCTSLKQISIPHSVTTIGYYAFEKCTLLKHIRIPSSVKSIGYGVFADCSSLKEITIPPSITSIGDYSFKNCTSLKQIRIHTSIYSIGYYAFEKCSSLERITIPTSVYSIGYGAFSNCTSLKQITIPSSVTSIGKYAFYGCTLLSNESKQANTHQNQFEASLNSV